MKKLLTLTLISLFCVTLYAQNSNKPSFISINVGPSLPLKDYQTIDSLDPTNANIGLALDLEGGIFLNNFFGIGASAGTFINPIDVNDLSSQYQTQTNASNGTVTATATNWVNLYAMAGPYLSIGTDIIRLDLKFLGGFINSIKPEVVITTDQGGQTSREVNKAESATAFGYNYGAHLRIKLAGPLALRINAEGISTKQEFDNTVNNTTTQQKIKTEFQNLNLGIGLLINF